jgi:predicted metal-dependent hydrolase
LQFKIINIDGIEILLVKSPRARYISISIRPFRGVRVSIPERISFSEGERLAYAKLDWIHQHLDKIKLHEKSFPLITHESNFRTRSHILELLQGGDKIVVRVRNGIIKVKYPNDKGVSSPAVQKAIRKGILEAYREEAKEFLPKRLNDLSDRHNLPYKEVFIKNIKSRWGSCSGRNNINLSIHLMRLPNHLIDYVLLHELVHTKIKNHSRTFWHALNMVTGNAKILDKELSKHHLVY